MDNEVTLSDVVQLAIDQKLADMYVCFPGYIVSYNSETQTASVQIAIDKIFTDLIVPHPVLDNVPVQMPRSATGGLSFPLVENDDVLVQFIQRGTGNWKQNPGHDAPDLDTSFDLNDGVIIPCVHPREVPYELREATEVMGDKVLVDAVESAQVTAPKLFLGDKETTFKAPSMGGAAIPVEVFNILNGILLAMQIPMQTPTGPATLVGNVMTDVQAAQMAVAQILGTVE